MTWRFDRGATERRFHGYIIYPKGVPLGDTAAEKSLRGSNQFLTTAEVSFACGKDRSADPSLKFDANLSEALGNEIFSWFDTEFQKAEYANDETTRLLVYDQTTRKVEVHKEGSDGQTPEHIFNEPCRLPAEKLGLVTPRAAPVAAPTTTTAKRPPPPPSSGAGGSGKSARRRHRVTKATTRATRLLEGTRHQIPRLSEVMPHQLPRPHQKIRCRFSDRVGAMPNRPQWRLASRAQNRSRLLPNNKSTGCCQTET